MQPDDDGGRPRLSPPVRVALLVAGVVVLLAIGARGLGWRGRVDLSADLTSPANIGPIVVLTLVALGAILFVVLLLTSQKAAGQRHGPRRRKTLAQQLLTLAVIFAVVYLLTRLGPLRDRRENNRDADSAPNEGESDCVGDACREAAWSWWPVVVAGVLVLLLAGVTVLAYRHRATVRPIGMTDAETAEEVRQVVAAGRAALGAVDDARLAVIRAYAAMESALAGAGLARRLADTPTDLLERAAGSGLFGPAGTAAAAELTALFRRARFSERELPPSARVQAANALGRLEEELRVVAAAATSEPGGP